MAKTQQPAQLTGHLTVHAAEDLLKRALAIIGANARSNRKIDLTLVTSCDLGVAQVLYVLQRDLKANGLSTARLALSPQLSTQMSECGFSI